MRAWQRAAGRNVSILNRYIAGTLLSAVALVMAVLLMLGLMFIFIGEQGDVGVGHYSMLDALAYSAMTLPQFALEAFPAGALIGALLGIGVLARSHELTVMRVLGHVEAAPERRGADQRHHPDRRGDADRGVSGAAAGATRRPSRRRSPNTPSMSFAGAGGAWIRDGNTILDVAGCLERRRVRRHAGVRALGR